MPVLALDGFACGSAEGFGADQHHTALKSQSSPGSHTCAGLHSAQIAARSPACSGSGFQLMPASGVPPSAARSAADVSREHAATSGGSDPGVHSSGKPPMSPLNAVFGEEPVPVGPERPQHDEGQRPEHLEHQDLRPPDIVLGHLRNPPLLVGLASARACRVRQRRRAPPDRRAGRSSGTRCSPAAGRSRWGCLPRPSTRWTSSSFFGPAWRCSTRTAPAPTRRPATSRTGGTCSRSPRPATASCSCSGGGEEQDAQRPAARGADGGLGAGDALAPVLGVDQQLRGQPGTRQAGRGDAATGGRPQPDPGQPGTREGDCVLGIECAAVGFRNAFNVCADCDPSSEPLRSRLSHARKDRNRAAVVRCGGDQGGIGRDRAELPLHVPQQQHDQRPALHQRMGVQTSMVPRDGFGRKSPKSLTSHLGPSSLSASANWRARSASCG